MDRTVCRSCGTAVPADAAVCPSCGTTDPVAPATGADVAADGTAGSDRPQARPADPPHARPIDSTGPGSPSGAAPVEPASAGSRVRGVAKSIGCLAIVVIAFLIALMAGLLDFIF